MNSNNDIENTRKVSARKWDELLDRYFSSVILPKVDTERVMTLTRLKILHERMSRSRSMWRMISLCSVAACFAIVVAMTVAYREEKGVAASSVILADGTASDDTGLDDYNELNVPAGQRMTLMLADGTRLMANSRSQVRYPSRFDGDTRRIWASGEVYLEVAKDADRPFVMSGDGFDVTVLGTTFCVSSYHPGKASIVLIEGSVAVTTDTDECIRMRPSQKVDIAEGSVDGISVVDTSFYTCWTKGAIMLKDQTLGQVAERLSIYYDVDIETDPTLYNRRLYGHLDLKEDIGEVLSVLCSTISMDADKASDDSRRYRLTAR
ncbi:FecR family protein [Muribaculum intestinale]|uniref:FecR family protein n=1 Tax=Muribaculum intestinale TaxID=1796646 RepID=UPI00248AF7C8|nr:FecR domain-containing protein [Muribaculum intestinale]